MLTTMGRPQEPIFQASAVLKLWGPVHSDCPNSSRMWMLSDAKYSMIWVRFEFVRAGLDSALVNPDARAHFRQFDIDRPSDR